MRDLEQNTAEVTDVTYLVEEKEEGHVLSVISTVSGKL